MNGNLAELSSFIDNLCQNIWLIMFSSDAKTSTWRGQASNLVEQDILNQ